MKFKDIKGKLKKVGLVGTISVLLTGCGKDYNPENNVPAAVYGPPETMESPAPIWNNNEFDPSENEIDDVYGPPEYFDENEEEEYSADQNEVPCVYGPPEYFEDGGN